MGKTRTFRSDRSREERPTTTTTTTRTKKTLEEFTMKTWTKPAVREQEVGLEVTSYLPAEIDLI